MESILSTLINDMLKTLLHQEEKQSKMCDAEVMSTAIVAMLYFKGNFRMACQFMYENNYIPGMLSKSRFNRRLHRIADLFLSLFFQIGEHWKNMNERSTYVVDSYPISA